MDESRNHKRLPPPLGASRPARPRRAIGLLLLLLAGSASGQTFTITFDAGDPINGLPVGTVLSNQYAASTGATFSPNRFTGDGGPTGPWASNTDVTIVSSTGTDVGGLGTAPPGTAPVSGNILRSFNGWLSEDGDASIGLVLAEPVQGCAVTFAGVANAASTRLFAFDGDVEVDVAVATPGAGQERLIVAAQSISSIAITPGDFNDWVGLDDITCFGDDILSDGFE